MPVLGSLVDWCVSSLEKTPLGLRQPTYYIFPKKGRIFLITVKRLENGVFRIQRALIIDAGAQTSSTKYSKLSL